MVTELVFLSVKPSASETFEAAFGSVADLLAAAEGHEGHRLVRSLHPEDAYLLEVRWRDLHAHVGVFETSAAHVQFMAALEPLLVEAPRVVHV